MEYKGETCSGPRVAGREDWETISTGLAGRCMAAKYRSVALASLFVVMVMWASVRKRVARCGKVKTTIGFNGHGVLLQSVPFSAKKDAHHTVTAG